MNRAEFMRAFALAAMPPIGRAHAAMLEPAAVTARLGGQVSVLDYPSFQHAHDALPDMGGTIHVPAGWYSSKTVPAFNGLVITKPTALIGVANGYGCALSFLVHDGDKDVDAIFLNIAGSCLLENLFITRPDSQTAPGAGRGVRWYKKGAAGRMAGLTINNVVVWRSPNWSFEFVCDGYEQNYVSKLVMIECTAFEAASGGSLRLGGAGSNNNFFSRCEFNGPGFGRYYDVNGCKVTAGKDAVSASGSSPFTGVAPGDEVFGMGIAIGTTVASASASDLKLSQPAIETPDGATQLAFWREGGADYPGEPLRRGHVHLARTSISRFLQCSFQGPGTTPVLSTDLVSNDLVLRDCYREREIRPGDTIVDHSFQISGMNNFLVDGLYHQGHAAPSRLLKTGPSGMAMGRITNAQLLVSALTGTDVVRLYKETDELVIDNSMEQSSVTGERRGLVVAGAGAAIPAAQRGGANRAVLSLPNGSDDVFLVNGSEPVTSIVTVRPKHRVTLVFTGAAPLTNGSNLRLNGDCKGGPNRTITLICDGTNWLELSRSANG